MSSYPRRTVTSLHGGGALDSLKKCVIKLPGLKSPTSTAGQYTLLISDSIRFHRRCCCCSSRTDVAGSLPASLRSSSPSLPVLQQLWRRRRQASLTHSCRSRSSLNRCLLLMKITNALLMDFKQNIL